MLISICLIVKNEAGNLRRLLASTRGLPAELVVVDTGSSDDTVAIAQSFGARVLTHTWQRDFAAARNASLEAACGAWALVLDADEELPAETRVAIPDLIASGRADGYTFVYHSPMPPSEPVTFTEFPVLRLFRNDPRYRFEQAIHEQVLPSILRAGGTMQPTELRLVHYGYLSPQVQGGQARNQRDREVIEAVLAHDQDNAYMWFQLGALELRDGQPGAAELCLQHAARRAAALGASERALTFRLLSGLALNSGDPEAALLHAEHSLTAMPADKNSLGLLSWTQAHVILGQRYTDAAMACVQPDRPSSEYAIGLEHLKRSQHHFTSAARGYRQALANPDLAPGPRAQLQRNLRVCEQLLGQAG
jgi:glycosyltransferase involved in cell wall biosynthesis